MSVTLKLAETNGYVFEESPTYSFGNLVSDIGGALGLILGLSVLDIILMPSKIISHFLKTLVNSHLRMSKFNEVKGTV